MSTRFDVVALAAALIAPLASGCATSGGVSGRSSPGPLHTARLMGFAATTDAARSCAFYEGKLGLRLAEDDAYALVFESGGSLIRVQKMKEHRPQPFTILGWQVDDIRATSARLEAAGVTLERFDWMDIQDDAGIATFSNGDQVVWFKDPDGNILGIAQLTPMVP